MANCRMWIVCGICSPPELVWDDSKEFGGIPWRATLPDGTNDVPCRALAKWYPGTPYYGLDGHTSLDSWLEHHSHDSDTWGPGGDGPDHFRIEYA